MSASKSIFLTLTLFYTFENLFLKNCLFIWTSHNSDIFCLPKIIFRITTNNLSRQNILYSIYVGIGTARIKVAFRKPHISSKYIVLLRDSNIVTVERGQF